MNAGRSRPVLLFFLPNVSNHHEISRSWQFVVTFPFTSSLQLSQEHKIMTSSLDFTPAMSYSDLKVLVKQHGVCKANAKKDVMADALLNLHASTVETEQPVAVVETAPDAAIEPEVSPDLDGLKLRTASCTSTTRWAQVDNSQLQAVATGGCRLKVFYTNLPTTNTHLSTCLHWRFVCW